MKMREGSVLMLIVILAGAAMLSYTATKVFRLEDDNVFEEVVEDVIEEKTGLDIDISYDSPEDSDELLD